MSAQVTQVVEKVNSTLLGANNERRWMATLLAAVVLVLLAYIILKNTALGAKLGLNEGMCTSSEGDWSWLSGGAVKAAQAQDQVYFGKNAFMNSMPRQNFTPSDEKKMDDGSVVVDDVETGVRYRVVMAQTWDDASQSYKMKKIYVPWKGASNCFSVGGIVVDSSNCVDTGLGAAEDAWWWLGKNIGSERDPNAQFNTMGLKKENMSQIEKDDKLNSNLHGYA